MKHPQFTTATILFVSAMLSGMGAWTEKHPILFIISFACFMTGIFAAFGKDLDNNND